MENLIKDMKLYTRSDKTACSRWEPNQFRLFLHMGAYWLLHSVRPAASTKLRWCGAMFETIRNLFVKVAYRVEELKSRTKQSFPASPPHSNTPGLICARRSHRGSRIKSLEPHARRSWPHRIAQFVSLDYAGQIIGSLVLDGGFRNEVMLSIRNARRETTMPSNF